MRHSEIKVDLITWSRLLSRAAPAITIGDTSSPYGSKQTQIIGANLKPTALGFDSDSSPPQSESQSGENSPKTPDTPSSPREPSSPIFTKHDARSGMPQRNSVIQNGDLPPVEPVSDAELMHIPDQIILPPPPQFQLVIPPAQFQLLSDSVTPFSHDSIDFSLPFSKDTSMAKNDPMGLSFSPKHTKEGDGRSSKKNVSIFPNGSGSTSQQQQRPPSPLPDLVSKSHR